VTSCLGCFNNEYVENIFDYELNIGRDMRKPKGHLTNNSIAYLE
jgi:hypothetical protein